MPEMVFLMRQAEQHLPRRELFSHLANLAEEAIEDAERLTASVNFVANTEDIVEQEQRGVGCRGGVIGIVRSQPARLTAAYTRAQLRVPGTGAGAGV